MLTSTFQDVTLSRLGFGTMRLPVHDDDTINEAAVDEMVDYAIAHGVNYFDTAWFYHNYKAEETIGKFLSRYPRAAYNLASKMPGHLLKKPEEVSQIFEEQLRRCRVDYFDFYLLHGVSESSIEVFTDPAYGIMDYLLEQKKLGRIRHLGFSTHADLPLFRKYVEENHDKLEFCQIQLNYLDWTLQQAKEKVDILHEFHMPIWVMEPVRGGALVNLPEQAITPMKELHPDWSIASWGFRWLLGIDHVDMILSGMSNLQQMQDNIHTFSTGAPLNAEECRFIMDVADKLKDSIPCTGCKYCTNECPQNLPIPTLIRMLNDLRYTPSDEIRKKLHSLPAQTHPSACLECGSCAKACPQDLPIPELLKELAEKY